MSDPRTRSNTRRALRSSGPAPFRDLDKTVKRARSNRSRNSRLAGQVPPRDLDEGAEQAQSNRNRTLGLAGEELETASLQVVNASLQMDKASLQLINATLKIERSRLEFANAQQEDTDEMTIPNSRETRTFFNRTRKRSTAAAQSTSQLQTEVLSSSPTSVATESSGRMLAPATNNLKTNETNETTIPKKSALVDSEHDMENVSVELATAPTTEEEAEAAMDARFQEQLDDLELFKQHFDMDQHPLGAEF